MMINLMQYTKIAFAGTLLTTSALMDGHYPSTILISILFPPELIN